MTMPESSAINRIRIASIAKINKKEIGDMTAVAGVDVVTEVEPFSLLFDTPGADAWVSTLTGTLRVECIAGGADGQTAGGGGGAYARSDVEVVKGEQYSFLVGNTGLNSSWQGTVVVARRATGPSGGTNILSTGTLCRSGGDGAASLVLAGGGGGAGGPTAPGASGTGTDGGLGGGGDAGSGGGAGESSGGNGTLYGGGGGGALPGDPGTGAPGCIRITYPVPGH